MMRLNHLLQNDSSATSMGRRQFLVAGGVAITSGCTAVVNDRGEDSSRDQGKLKDGHVRLTPVISNLQEPVSVAQSPVEADVYFVADRYGWIRRADDEGFQGDPVVSVKNDSELESWEQGLLGFALHPEFESTRKLYVHYSGTRRQGTPADYSHTFVIREFTLDQTFTNAADSRTILEIPMPGRRHNGGEIAFDHEGNLLITVGDGGNQADKGLGHADDWYEGLPGGNGQDVSENLLGSILRIDVDNADGKQPYAIPQDNPLVGSEGRDEHFAWGFRNPYSITIADETVYVADVGEDWYEEVNRVEKGGNYGWNVREGTACYNKTGDPDPDRSCPSSTPDGRQLRDPSLVYPSVDKDKPVAIIGGPVYEGDSLPFLDGKYLFGDVISMGETPLLFAATRNENQSWSYEQLEITVDGESARTAVLGFDSDASGTCYVCTTNFRKEGAGTVYRLDPVFE